MKTTYLELLKKIDTSIFQNYKIVDDEEIDINENELENCINNSIAVKIEMLVDFSWYEPLNYDTEKVTLIRSGWVYARFGIKEA